MKNDTARALAVIEFILDHLRSIRLGRWETVIKIQQLAGNHFPEKEPKENGQSLVA